MSYYDQYYYVAVSFTVIVVLICVFVLSNLFYQIYKKHTGQRYRVKTVIVQGFANHYYAQFKPGWNYNWGTIEKHISGYQVTANQSSVIPFNLFEEAEKVCCGYKEYRTPTKSVVNKESYTEVCDK